MVVSDEVMVEVTEEVPELDGVDVAVEVAEDVMLEVTVDVMLEVTVDVMLEVTVDVPVEITVADCRDEWKIHSNTMKSKTIVNVEQSTPHAHNMHDQHTLAQ